MRKPIIINILNRTEFDDEKDYLYYFSLFQDGMPQAYTSADFSPEGSVWKFYMNDATDIDITIDFFTDIPAPDDNVPESIVVTIDPGYAFGDGRHATTWLCVKFLAEYLDTIATDHREQLSLLDVGTGTGILSIVANRLGVGAIDAIDIYPHAVQCAILNMKLNGCKGVIIRESDIATFMSGRMYDIVMANIISEVIIANFDNLISLTAPGGIIIVSGINALNNDTVRKHISKRGLKTLDYSSRDNWYGYVLLKHA